MLDLDGLRIYDEPSTPIGLHAMTKPQITELRVRPYTYIVLFTDGLLKAGERYGEDIELENYLAGWRPDAGRDPQELTDDLLHRALELDRGQPSDDMTILTIAALPGREEANPVRRMAVSFPMA